MKKITILMILVFAIARANAQDYQISFLGSGASTNVDSVKVENLTQCTDTMLGAGDILNLKTTAGINLYGETGGSLNVFPNPVHGISAISFEAHGKTTLELYDVNGKRVLQVSETLSKGCHKYLLSGIGSGVYTLKITSGSFNYSAKIIGIYEQEGKTELRHIESASVSDSQSPVSNYGKIADIKDGKSLIDMPYTTGDILKLTGFSGGEYINVFMLVPVQSQPVTFDFTDCTDADSNHYATVAIGSKVVMAENLKTTKFKTGAAIPLVTGSTWSSITTPAYCWYDNDAAANKDIYGALYNWFAVNTGNLCPTGWHVPTSTEWLQVFSPLGGSTVAGGKMKEACSPYWLSPNTGATNSSGFTARPSGNRSSTAAYYNITEAFTVWSSTPMDSYNAKYSGMNNDAATVINIYGSKQFGFAVRCLKD